MADRNIYPHLRGRQAKQRLQREQREEQLFHARYDEVEAECGADRISADDRRHRAAKQKQDEADRVQQIIERDKAEHMREIERAAAEIRVREGVTAAIVHTAVEPTPEWLSKAETETYHPRQPDGTVAEVKTVRRVRTPTILKMLNNGNLDNDQYRACAWYAECHEMAGLDGNVRSVNMSREVFGNDGSREVFTERQQDAQRQLRMAKAVIPKDEIRFFEAVVLNNVPVRRAACLIRKRRSRALILLKKSADSVFEVGKNIGKLA